MSLNFIKIHWMSWKVIECHPMSLDVIVQIVKLGCLLLVESVTEPPTASSMTSLWSFTRALQTSALLVSSVFVSVTLVSIISWSLPFLRAWESTRWTEFKQNSCGLSDPRNSDCQTPEAEPGPSSLLFFMHLLSVQECSTQWICQDHQSKCVSMLWNIKVLT